jgi:hypothetical protein
MHDATIDKLKYIFDRATVFRYAGDGAHRYKVNNEPLPPGLHDLFGASSKEDLAAAVNRYQAVYVLTNSLLLHPREPLAAKFYLAAAKETKLEGRDVGEMLRGFTDEVSAVQTDPAKADTWKRIVSEGNTMAEIVTALTEMGCKMEGTRIAQIPSIDALRQAHPAKRNAPDKFRDFSPEYPF